MKFNDYFPNPVVINLDRRQDRLERFDQQAKALGISYTRFKAVEAVEPRLGCKLSHISALSICKDDIAFIFEDDSIFVEGFQAKFEQAMDSVPQDWQMLYLGAHLLQKQPVNDQWVRTLECSSTHAYAVKKEFISRLIKQGMNPENHIDVDFSGLQKEMVVYAARPTLVYQGASYSDLLGDEVDYTYLYF